MRKGLLWALGIWIGGVAPLAAQELPPPSDAPMPAIVQDPPSLPSNPTPTVPRSVLGTNGPPTDASAPIAKDQGIPSPEPAAPKNLPPVTNPGSARRTAGPPAAIEAPTKAQVVLRDPAQVMTNPPLVDTVSACDTCSNFRFWASAEYLMWWVKDAPMPVPLVTTGDPTVGFAAGVNSAGALGSPGTQVLAGGNSVNYHTFSGLRLTLGGWLDPEQTFGLESSSFFLGRGSNTYSASSNAAGNPPLYFPAFNVAAGQERALVIADPLRGFSGNVSIGSSLDLWGTELNGLFSIWRRPGMQLALLTGFRYLNLHETLHIDNTTTDFILLNIDTSHDRFDTRNQFYGGQLGSRFTLQRDRWVINLTGKLGLGNNHEVVHIQGETSQTALPGGFAPSPGNFPGGVFAQPSNIGTFTKNQFAVIPAVEFNIGYQITPRIRTFVGYDFLYWNQVVRPGNQIDRNINPTQSTVFGNGTLVGPASPTPLFQRTDFWVQGVSFGVAFKF